MKRSSSGRRRTGFRAEVETEGKMNWMRSGYSPAPRDVAVPAFPEYRSRWRLARDLGVFEAKLALDGLKDFVLAPLAVAAVIADFVIPEESRGVFLRAVLRLGERFDRWLNLYGLRRRLSESRIFDEGGSDVILDYLENTALDVHRGVRGRRTNKPSD